MALRGSDILRQHPTNPTHDTHISSASSKLWARDFAAIKNLHVHTVLRQGAVDARFDALLPELEDDALRASQSVYPPNNRRWRLYSEEDGINWFHTEISNPVLGLFAAYPSLLQAAHEKPLDTEAHSETVDVSYSVSPAGQRAHRRHVVIGEFKRCLISPDQWQDGKLVGSQRSFSQEARGYAFKYACPQIFCFDGKHLLMLQFRAKSVSDIRDPNCPVDCWILPRHNPGGVALRYAFYRFLGQGFRRCQGSTANPSLELRGVPTRRRRLFNGVPVWKIDGAETDTPWGYQRQLHRDTGAFYWADSAGNALLDENGTVIWDTLAFWGV